MEDVKVKDLDDLIKTIGEQVAEIDIMSAQLTEKNKELATLEKRATDLLNILERDEYSGPFGKIKLHEMQQVATPKTWEQKEAWMNYLRERGGEELVQQYITFNSTSLKSFVNREIELREEQGDLNRAFPGIGEPTVFKKLRFKKA